MLDDTALTAAIEAFKSNALSGLSDALRAAIEAYEAAQWRPIEEAPRDGSVIWGALKRDIWDHDGSHHRMSGIQLPLRHEGTTSSGYDIGWGVAAPLGYGGIPDLWIVGWRPLPAPPVEAAK